MIYLAECLRNGKIEATIQTAQHFLCPSGRPERCAKTNADLPLLRHPEAYKVAPSLSALLQVNVR